MTVTPEHIRQSNLIEGIDSEVDDLLGLAAWAWLNQQHAHAITPAVIKQLHIVVMSGLEDFDGVGVWRQHDVHVGGYVAPPWREVPKLMDLWCEDTRLGPNATVGREWVQTMHVQFEKIHPFFDGNGRTGRLLMWWHEEHLSLPATLLQAHERAAYYKWFETNGSDSSI